MTAADATIRFADRYRVSRRLGVGGMATVFLAEDERLGRPVAVKRLHAGSPEDLARRFEREARLGASLNHPNLVSVYDTLADLDRVLIVMEYVDGPSLEQMLKQGPIDAERTLEILSDIAAALDHAHARAILHRDLKPANILVRNDGRAKLADLGIAIAMEEDASLTHTGTVLGTAAYMAPEQIQGHEISIATDVYALGAVAFEMLAGRPARRGSTAMEVAYSVVHTPPPDLRAAWPEAPAGAAGVLAEAMATEPGERPQRAGEFVERLRAGLEGTSGAVDAAALAPLGALGADGALDGGSAGGVTSALPQTDRDGAPGDRSEDAGDRTHVMPSRPQRPRRARLVALSALLLALAVALAAAVVSLTGGSVDERAASPAAGAPASDPGEIVRAFYRRAAAGDASGAWRLATPRFQRELGGFTEFRRAMAELESIDFSRAQAVSADGRSARVQARAVADYTDGVDRCRGTFTLVRGGPSGWLIDRARVTCPKSSRPSDGSAALGTARPEVPRPTTVVTSPATGGSSAASDSDASGEGSADRSSDAPDRQSRAPSDSASDGDSTSGGSSTAPSQSPSSGSPTPNVVAPTPPSVGQNRGE